MLDSAPKTKIKSEIGAIFRLEDGVRIELPKFASLVKAGFPSPADDYIERKIDLNRDLIKNPEATFYAEVEGDSMEPLIHFGSLLVIDRAAETCHGDIVLAQLRGEFCMKRLFMPPRGAIMLISENPAYQPIRITGDMDFMVCGKIVHVIQSF